jgi:SAM-dependent methyltransferase
MSKPKVGSKPAEFDTYSRNYDETVNRALAFSGLRVDFFTRAKMDYLLDIIERLTPTAGSAEVLDVGCGVGNAHALLAGRVGRLAGVDVSPKCVDTARERNPWVEYASYNGVRLPYPDNSFDVAFAISVFHHVPIPERLPLAVEIRRILRPGGAFAMFEHNPLNPLTMRVVNNCEFDKDAVLLHRRDSEEILLGAGFRELATRFILTLPAAGATLRAIDQLFAKLPLGAQFYTLGRA